MMEIVALVFGPPAWRPPLGPSRGPPPEPRPAKHAHSTLCPFDLSENFVLKHTFDHAHKDGGLMSGFDVLGGRAHLSRYQYGDEWMTCDQSMTCDGWMNDMWWVNEMLMWYKYDIIYIYIVYYIYIYIYIIVLHFICLSYMSYSCL